MDDKTPIISLITPTYNRANELTSLIESLSSQTVDLNLFELIIVDDGSTDYTENIISEHKKNISYSLVYIFQHNSGPGEARNNGLRHSKGKLILFIDSDCEADNKWLEIIYNEYLSNPFDCFGGPDGSKDNFSLLQKTIDFSMTSFLTTGGMRGHSKKMLSKFYPRTHNMGITREVYEKIGGFGKLRHGQDIEYSNRIINNNFSIRFISNALVYHRRRTSIKLFFKQVFNWGVARINLGKIDRNMLEPIHFIPGLATSISVLLIISSFYSYLGQYLILFCFSLLLVASIIGSIKKRNILIFFLLLIIIPIQVFGYGSGFILAFFKRFIFNQKEFVGYSKKYYGK